MEGWEVLELIRRRKQTRVIMLTANGRLEQKVRGLESGADDYLVKPFQFPELLARIRTLLRRGEAVTLPSNLRLEEHTSELQSLMRNSYAIFCLQKKISNYTCTTATVATTSMNA